MRDLFVVILKSKMKDLPQPEGRRGARRFCTNGKSGVPKSL